MDKSDSYQPVNTLPSVSAGEVKVKMAEAVGGGCQFTPQVQIFRRPSQQQVGDTHLDHGSKYRRTRPHTVRPSDREEPPRKAAPAPKPTQINPLADTLPSASARRRREPRFHLPAHVHTRAHAERRPSSSRGARVGGVHPTRPNLARAASRKLKLLPK